MEFCSVLALTMTLSDTGNIKILDSNSKKGKSEKNKKMALKIERFARMILPLSYMVFVIGFFFVVNNVSHQKYTADNMETIQELGLDDEDL